MTKGKRKYIKEILLKPDPFSKCPAEVQLAAYQLIREKIEGWKKGISLYRESENFTLSLDIFKLGVIDFIVTTKSFHFNFSWLKNAFDITLDTNKIFLTLGIHFDFGRVFKWFKVRRVEKI